MNLLFPTPSFLSTPREVNYLYGCTVTQLIKLCGGGRKEGMGNNKFIEYTERNDDLGMAQVVQGMAVRELSDLELVIISASMSIEFREYINVY